MTWSTRGIAMLALLLAAIALVILAATAPPAHGLFD
jgi:hypothetical protein